MDFSFTLPLPQIRCIIYCWLAWTLASFKINSEEYFFQLLQLMLLVVSKPGTKEMWALWGWNVKRACNEWILFLPFFLCVWSKQLVSWCLYPFLLFLLHFCGFFLIFCKFILSSYNMQRHQHNTKIDSKTLLKRNCFYLSANQPLLSHFSFFFLLTLITATWQQP